MSVSSTTTTAEPLDYRTLFEHIPGLYLVLSPAFCILAVSSAYCVATRTTRTQIVGRNLFDVFPDNPDDPHADGSRNLRASLGRVLASGRADTMPIQKYDIRRSEAEGGGFEVRYWSPVNAPILNAAGRVAQIIHRVEDVTEFVRLRSAQDERDRAAASMQQRTLAMEVEIFDRARELAEARLATQVARRAESRLRELADAMPQIIWTAEPGGRHDYFNRRWYEFTGLSRDVDPSQGWQRVLNPDDRAAAVDAWERSIRSGEPFEAEYRLFDRATDSYRWFLSRALPVRDDAGRVTRWYGSCTDIDAAKRAQADVQHARDAAENANQAKDRFLAVLSHELRTPLTPVLLTVSLLENSQDVSDEVREDIQTIRRHVELEARLIDDLLDLTRVTRGKLQVNMETVDAHLLMRNALEISLPERPQHVTLELRAVRHHVRADPARLQQVFWNLLSNASKFTPADRGITVRSTNRADGTLRLEVIDQGAGIAPDVMPIIFNAFEQGDMSLTRRFGGLGLGLTICKAFVEAQGGHIDAASAGAGLGATFGVEFPTVAPAVAPRTILPTLLPPKPARGRLHILLVEDHLGTMEAMAKLLQSLGHQVKTAACVKEALAIAAREEIDLVISDLALPDGSGHDVMRLLKTRYNVKGIAVSGFSMDEDLERSRESGFNQHLTKPVALEQLEAAIENVAF